jgi:hypothetical protein
LFTYKVLGNMHSEILKRLSDLQMIFSEFHMTFSEIQFYWKRCRCCKLVFIRAWSSSNDIRFRIHGWLDYKLIWSLFIIDIVLYFYLLLCYNPYLILTPFALDVITHPYLDTYLSYLARNICIYLSINHLNMENTRKDNSSLFNEFVCKFGLFSHK